MILIFWGYEEIVVFLGGIITKLEYFGGLFLKILGFIFLGTAKFQIFLGYA